MSYSCSIISYERVTKVGEMLYLKYLEICCHEVVSYLLITLVTND